MEEEELRAKAMASMSISAKASSTLKTNKTKADDDEKLRKRENSFSSPSPNAREEGELSSGEDDGAAAEREEPEAELNRELPAQSIGADPPTTEHVPASLRNKHTQSSIFGGKRPPANGLAGRSRLQSATAMARNHGKQFEMNPMPSRSNNQSPGWYPHAGADYNLVIRFSDDDDSGSGSEEQKSERATERRETDVGVDKVKRPAALTHLKTKKLQQPPANQTELLRRKIPLTRKFNPSIARTQVSNVRGPGASSSVEESRIRKNGSHNKASTSQEPRRVQGAKSPESELEILRRKIALRENELKLQRKSMPQHKEGVSGSYEDYNSLRAETNTDNSYRPASITTIGLTTDEKEKHLKLVENSHIVSNSDGEPQMPVHAKDVASEFEEQVLENVHVKGVPVSTRDPRGNKQHGTSDQRIPNLSRDCVGTKQGESSTSFTGTMLSTYSNLGMPLKRVTNSVGIAGNCSKAHKGCGLVDASSSLKRISRLTSNAEDDGAPEMPPSKKFCPAMLKLPGIPQGTRSASSFQDKNSSQHNLVNSGERSEDMSRKHQPYYVFDGCSNQVTERALGTSDWNAMGLSGMDIQSVANLEELQDKELEEAQELRHRCELEERSALKAYRIAQRALIDANERCSYLYRRREMFSAQHRSLAMENSTSLWCSRWQGEDALGKNVPKADVNLLPRICCQSPAEQEVMDQEVRESNLQLIEGAPLNTSCHHTSGGNLTPEPGSEPDASTSEQLHHKISSAVDGVFSPSNNPDVSADEDEAIESRLICRENVEKVEERAVSMNEELEIKSYMETNKDSEQGEALLRSKLFAQLGMRTLSKNHDLVSNEERAVDKSADVENMETNTSMGKLSVFSGQKFVKGEKSQMADREGKEMPGSRTCQILVRDHDHSRRDKAYFGYGFHRSVNPEESSSSLDESCRETYASVLSLPSSTLKILFRHTKFILSGRFRGHQTKHKQAYKISREETTDVHSYGCQLALYRTDVIGNHIKDASSGKLESGTTDLAIDPSWPFCMFDLRGKCNNDECVSQHAKDYTRRNLKHINDSSNSDGLVSPSSVLGKPTDARELPSSIRHYIVPVPTYLIGSNLIKADKQLPGYLLSRSIHQYWRRNFCASFAVPFSLPRILSPDVPSLQAGDGYAEDHDSWNRISLYFPSQDGTMKQTVQLSAASEESLEQALNLCNGTVNEWEGLKEASTVLSRALEVDRNSIVLWVVYLHIFYRKEKAIGQDDLFSLAIHSNEGSYELWLMYINSRMHLRDRLDAYDSALSTLCRLACTPGKESKYSSACILDLFLQMVDFLRISGDVEKAISKIFGVLSTAMDFNSAGSTWLLDILGCSTIPDQCILWVCCVYLTIYEKLPDIVVQRLESEQELLFGLEWPSVQLTSSKEELVIELMNMGVDAVRLSIDGDSRERDHLQETVLRSAHSLAVNHIKCVAALKGLDCVEDLLVKYLKQYPTCIELVLILARFRKDCSGEESYDGFEEALLNWPSDVPGIQCLWNQYAEYALENGSISLAEALMRRLFESTCKVQDGENGKTDCRGNGLRNSSDICSFAKSDSFTCSSSKDQLFGLLNLSLHRLLQRDEVEARTTIDKALKLAAAEDLKHCVREHASFLLSDMSDLDALAFEIPNLLLGYLVDISSFPISEPLSRRFHKSIKKPRIRKLINVMLGPVSLDCSLMNSILKDWYGPSLLPENFGKLKDLVDFVEGLMELLPANYQLAMSACRLVKRSPNIVGIVSTTAMFWASGLLVNSIFQTFPVAPEQVWVEAADVLDNLEMKGMSERFHEQAVTVYPFSIALWMSYLNSSKKTGDVGAVIDAARERGIELNRILKQKERKENDMRNFNDAI